MQNAWQEPPNWLQGLWLAGSNLMLPASKRKMMNEDRFLSEVLSGPLLR